MLFDNATKKPAFMTSLRSGTEGSVMSFNSEIDIVQIPESGMAVQASWGGTVYSVDAGLN